MKSKKTHVKKHKKTSKIKIKNGRKNKSKSNTKHKIKKITKVKSKKHKIKGGTKEDDMYRLFTRIVIDIQKNDLDAIKEIITNNPDIINYQIGERKSTLLQQAVLYDKPDVVELLLDMGADINLFDDINYTPLIMAILENKNDPANILIERGAYLNIKDEFGRYPLHLVAQNKNNYLLKKLVEKKPEIIIDSMDSSNVTPLSYATSFGNIDGMRLLLDNGADVNSKDINSWTPLFYAIRYGNLNAVKLLIDRGANITMQNKFGNTPLQVACKRGNLEIVELLLEKGANKNINAQDNLGLTALMCAVLSENVDIVNLILENGADMTLKDKNNISVLKFPPKGSSVETLLQNKYRELIQKNIAEQNKIKSTMANIAAEELIREEDERKEKENNKKFIAEQKKREKEEKKRMDQQLKREKEETERVAKETELFSKEENYQKEQQLYLQELEKQQELERMLQEKEEREAKEANDLLEKQIQQAIEESKKTYNSETLQIEVLAFWRQYFGSEENIKNIKTELAKMKLLEGTNSFEKLKEILPAYANKFISKDPTTNNIISLLYILIGLISNTLINNGIFLMLKGGSAIQNVSSQVPIEFIVPYESNDIDVVLINTNNIQNNITNTEENRNMAEQISKFLIWVTEENSKSILTKATNQDATHPIFKIILNKNKSLPLMDIDYNNLPDDMYNLYVANIYSKPFNLGQTHGIFNSPSIINLIYERIYYLIKYSEKTALKDFKSKSFLTGKIPKSLNYLVKNLFIMENRRETREDELRPFYHDLFNEFFNLYPDLKANFTTTHNYTIDQLIDLCIS